MDKMYHQGKKYSLFVLHLIMILLIQGCERNDVKVIKESIFENGYIPLGIAFENCSFIKNTTWIRIHDENNNRIIIVTAEVPSEMVFSEISKDSKNWLTIERNFFSETSQHVKSINLRLSFILNPDNSFKKGNVQVGLSSGTKIIWSQPILGSMYGEILDAISVNEHSLIKYIADQLNPSFTKGRVLLENFSGRNIDDFIKLKS